nr:DmsC/YnfH family molybdoenzyme membrane anchor subunit [Endozoicomonas montiporae]
MGSVCLFSHLDSWLLAMNVLSGFGHSWLSRELLALLVLNVCTTLWMVSHNHDSRKPFHQWMGVVTSITGIMAVLMSAHVYALLPSRPEWNTVLTHLTFLCTVLVLGITTVIVFIRAYDNLVVPSTIRYLLGLSVLATLVVVTLFVRHIDKFATHNWMTMYQLVGTVLGGALLFVMAGNSNRYKPEWVFLVMLLILSGEVAGRVSFYSSMVTPVHW